ncbi:hypothetical protein CEXT_280811 [Caerostris extrusa]|uniref:ATP synthase F0 subunit 8 n=1 Tax=Caerostris extrusa TaxID=172846 RepID=A0AAV4PFW1_CAEEX|nr:hypothetical protein CEXT_280811 [Caerostris extrusa]
MGFHQIWTVLTLCICHIFLYFSYNLWPPVSPAMLPHRGRKWLLTKYVCKLALIGSSLGVKRNSTHKARKIVNARTPKPQSLYSSVLQKTFKLLITETDFEVRSEINKYYTSISVHKNKPDLTLNMPRTSKDNTKFKPRQKIW